MAAAREYQVDSPVECVQIDPLVRNIIILNVIL